MPVNIVQYIFFLSSAKKKINRQPVFLAFKQKNKQLTLLLLLFLYTLYILISTKLI